LSQKYDQEFRAAEKYARKHSLNIWGDPALAQKYLRLKSKWGQRLDAKETADFKEMLISEMVQIRGLNQCP
jgi:hypothetical protein